MSSGEEPFDLPIRASRAPRRAQSFVDGRDGHDRWGRERKHLIACGEDWGHVCAAYKDEACPGEFNKGDRLMPLRVKVCNLACAACGGGGRVATHAYCGHGARGDPMFESAVAEMGGTLRMDAWTSKPSGPALKLPGPYVPVVERYAKAFGDKLTDLPAVFTTTQSAMRNRSDKRRSTTVRERLGDYEGLLGLCGLVKDDLLDDQWDDRHRQLRYLRDSEVDLMVVPQFCVPLDTEVLTREGFKAHDEVEVGDETIGFNPQTGRSEWTKVTAVHHYGPSPLVRVGNSRWSAVCTPEHRWLVEPARAQRRAGGQPHLRAVKDISGEERLVLAAPAEGGGSGLTPQEAAIVAWALTDGTVARGPVATTPSTGCHRPATAARHAQMAGLRDEGFTMTAIAAELGCSQGHVSRVLGGRLPPLRAAGTPKHRSRRALSVTITQSKPRGLVALRALLADVAHAERESRSAPGLFIFHLHADYAHALWEKAGLLDPGVDLCALVSALSVEARAAFMEAAWLAEGHYAAGGGLRIISQKRGPLASALALGAYLEGYRPAVRRANADPAMRAITLARPDVGVRRGHFKVAPLASAPTWCVTTELGTMTMRQGEQVSLTGQSYYDADQSCMALYNSVRHLAFYHLCREMGFEHVALDVPQGAQRWLHEEYMAFCARSQVTMIAVSMQTLGLRGSLDPRSMVGLRWLQEDLADDVAVLIFGLDIPTAQAQATRLLRGRDVTFLSKGPYAHSIFFELLPQGASAPKGWTRADVFAHNVRGMERVAQRSGRGGRQSV